ncbi:MAG: LamG-like jellyroll fold domain-containing protein, partial [Flavobacteriales bacterium]
MKKVFYIITAILFTVFANETTAQETIVSIGTGTGTSNGPPARPNSESYGQTLYYPGQVGQAGYITKLAYKRYDTQAYTNAMHWTVYLGNTTQTSFFGSLNYDDMIPVGNLTQVFDGNVEVTSTEIIVSFDTPFYYDGVNQLVVAVNELTLGKHHSYLKATAYGTATNAPAKAAINLSTFASVNASSPLASSDQMSATAQQANVDITFSTCLWPSAITATNPGTTTMEIGWTASALNESAWQVEAVPTGEAQGTGTVQSAGTNPYTFTGLDHSTVYDFYVRSDCGSSEYSEWKYYATGTTACGINTCFEEDFDSYNHLDEPRCFTTVSPAVTGAAVGNPGSLVLHIGGFGDTYTSLPEFASLNGGLLTFKGRSNGGAPYNQINVGTSSDPTNTATFTPFQAIAMGTAWADYTVDFSTYAGTDKYITVQYLNGVNGNTFVYLDEITFDGNGVCVFNKTFVDKDATAGNNDGTSWADAYTDLQDALTNHNGNDIWVAEGTYKPDASNRAATFSIPSGAKIYGGFAGTETAINQRIAGSNTTILSGDLSGNDNGTLLPTEATRQDNSYHVVTLKGDVQNVVLDGFTIADGNANGPIDNSCSTAAASRVYHARGAAIYANPYVINQVNSADVSNCIFENHTATEVSVYYAFAPCGVTNVTFDFDFDRCITRNNFCGTLSSYLFSASGGYGIVSQGSVTNSLFHDNETTASLGSVFYLVTSTANGGTHTALNIDINGNTFANNVSGDGSTFYTIRSQSSIFKNNIVWGNGSTSPFNASPTPVISSSLIEGGISSSLNVDPSFSDPNNDDFSLDCNSPAINFGDGTGISPTSLDLAGNPRFNGDLDLGAYEYDATFSASATESSVCQGDPVTFSASGVTNISWTGGVSDGVPFYPTSTDTYTVTGTDGNGCVSTRSLVVSVDASVADDNVTAPTEVCSGTSATISIASSTSGATYYLRDDSNNSIVDGPTAGTGSALSFSTGNLTSSKTFNVFAEGSAVVTQEGALEFDGANDYVLAPKPSGFAYNSAYTVEGWVKTPNPGASGGYQSIFFAGTTAASDLEMYVQQGSNAFVVVHNRGNGGTLQGATFSVPPNNTWFHLAVVYNGSTVTAYFDGVSQGAIAMATPVVSSGAQINFGYMQSSAFDPAWGSKNMSGSLDDFRLWSIAKAAGDIASGMGNCVAGTETGLEAYYNFEEGTGTTLTDLANGNNGTLTNMDNADWVSTGSVSCAGAGCDFELSQTVTINVTTGYNLTETASVCSGESFTFPDGSSQTITSQTVHTSNLTTVVAGCDSIIETTVNVNPSYD